MPCKQSASKEEFIRAVGFNMNLQSDRDKFQALWGDVTRYWCDNFETDDRRILKEEYARNATRPYKWAHISPQIIDQAIRNIWCRAQGISRQYYNLGASTDERVLNWVLKWLLWHVCRYRDWRNRKGRNNGTRIVRMDPRSFGGGAAGGSAGGTELPPHDFWATVLN